MNQTRTLLRADAAANRVRLLKAAREVFRERGVGAEMREISERAGIGIGTVYRNFPHKDDLLVEILTEALQSAIEAGAVAEAKDDPIEALTGQVRCVLSIGEQIGWIVDANAGGYLSERAREKLRADGRQFDSVGRLRRALKRAADAGLLRPGLDLELATTVLRGACSYTTVHISPVAKNLDNYARKVVQLLLMGIGSEAEAVYRSTNPDPETSETIEEAEYANRS